MGATKAKSNRRAGSGKGQSGGVQALREAVRRHCERAHFELTGDVYVPAGEPYTRSEADQAVLETWDALAAALRRAGAIRDARERAWKAWERGESPDPPPRRDLTSWLSIRLSRIERSGVFDTSPPTFFEPSTARDGLARAVIHETTEAMDYVSVAQLTRESIAKCLPPMRLIAIRSLLEGNFPESVTTGASPPSVVAAEVRAMRLAMKRALAAWRPDDLADPDGDYHRERLTFGL